MKLNHTNWWFQLFSSTFDFFLEYPGSLRWFFTPPTDQKCFLLPPPGRPVDHQRSADRGKRRVAAGPLQPRRHGSAEALHVVGGQLPRNHPAGGAASPSTGTSKKEQIQTQKSKKSIQKMTSGVCYLTHLTTCCHLKSDSSDSNRHFEVTEALGKKKKDK